MHVVVPDGIDDPARPSGGNVYDRRLCRELVSLGWTVREHTAPPGLAGDAGNAGLARVLRGLPDGAAVLVDGLLACPAPAAVVPEAGRLRLAVLLHMPLAEAVPEEEVALRERAVLTSAHAVVTTSRWARRWVVDHHGVASRRVHVAAPGADPGPVAPGTDSGDALLCVGAVTGLKGHDTLAAALAALADLDWRCTCVGATDLEPPYVADLRSTARRAGIADRLHLVGPLPPRRLEELRSGADLVVAPSRHESYGMAVTEGLARGLPVLATAVGGQPEAVGHAADGSRPGLLVPPGRPDRLAEALRGWLIDAGLRANLRRAAVDRRERLPSWRSTAERVAAALPGPPAVNHPGADAVSPNTTSRTD